MIDNEQRWHALTDSIHSAGLGTLPWQTALESLAEATGSRLGQLLVLGPDATMPLNILSGVEPDAIGQAEDYGVADPQINPRVMAGLAAPVLGTLAEADFIAPHEHRRHPHYREFAIPFDIPFICLTPLERRERLTVGLSVLRSQRQGHITLEQRKVFAAAAAHFRSAVRTQIALEGRGADLVSGAMEAIGVGAFVCDTTGQVQALTPAAEQLVTAGRGLQLRLKRLVATRASDQKTLDEAIHAAAGAPTRTIVLHGQAGTQTPVVLDVLPLPRASHAFSFAPRTLIVARNAHQDAERRATVLQSIYALTPAEIDIVRQLCEGAAVGEIAAARAVSVGTIRTQLKNLMTRMGVRRQVELLAHVNRL